MKIAIYDIIHLEQVLPLVSISRYLKQETILFTNEHFKKEIDRQTQSEWQFLEVVYTSEGQSEWQYMQRVKEILVEKKVELFLLNSTDGKHLAWYRLLQFVPHCKFVFNVHEVNNIFNSRYGFTLRSIFRHLGKKILLRRVDAFIVNTEAMKVYMLQKKVTQLPVFWIPAVVFHETDQAEKESNGEFTITIPGTIDERRRDYLFVLDVYEFLCYHLAIVPRLVIAGAPFGEYGKNFIKKAEELNRNGGKIQLFNNEIPEHEFGGILSASDLLWSPLILSTSIFDGIKEVYGQTKNSGNTHDAVRFAKPMLIPKQLITSKEIETSTLRYDSVQSCATIISELVSDPSKLTQLKVLANQNALHFTVDKVAIQFQEILRLVKS